jgi:hypothetical protein
MHGILIHLKEGWCHDMTQRLPELQHLYTPLFVKVIFHLLTQNNPLALEQSNFSVTPADLKCPYDREVVDTSPEDAIQNLLEIDEFLTKKRKQNEMKHQSDRASTRTTARNWLGMPTIEYRDY